MRMDEIGSENMNQYTLYDVLSTELVLNENTLYTVIMSAMHPEVYITNVRDNPL